MFKRFLSIMLTLASISLFALCGCENGNNSTNNTDVTTTTSITQNPLYAEISQAIDIIARADKTNSLEDELNKYPDYFVYGDAGFGGLKELKKCIKNNFYSCDTEYAIYSIEDVTSTYEKDIEKELLEDFEAKIDIQQVAKVEDGYRYYNYNDDQHIDDSTLVPSTEYFIKLNNTWYYGWGLTLNSEIQEFEE